MLVWLVVTLKGVSAISNVKLKKGLAHAIASARPVTDAITTHVAVTLR
jgi:hypothetical protein